MPPTPFGKLASPRFPSAALGLENSQATVVHLDRPRGGGFSIRRAATITLPQSLIQPSFDDTNISDIASLVNLLSEAALSAGLGKQEKWSVALPEAVTRVAILTLDTEAASRAELEDVLRWKYERSFGAPTDEIRVTRERLPADAQGRSRYLATAIRLSVLAEYESVFAELGWRAGLILPRHQGEALWLNRTAEPGDSLLISSHAEGFTAVMLRNKQPTIVRSVMCDAEDRDDELYRLLLFYRDRVVAGDNGGAPDALNRILVVGEGFDRNRVSEIVNETLETRPRMLDAAAVGLLLPSGDFSFDALAAPAGLATLAWS
ncbi:MAG: hypothetical protein QOJ64_2265 [Acidobacteriota bacterium]|jgi:hypothetical protein|nr:hypothetical protein [Acidobacteriota bacterium]